MSWFNNLTIRFKIFSLAGFGMFAFLSYFLYSSIISHITIQQLEQIESHSFPVLEKINAANLEFASISDNLNAAMNDEDRDLLEETRQRVVDFRQRLKDIATTDAELAQETEKLATAFDRYANANMVLAAGMIDDSIPSEEIYRRITDVKALQEAYANDYKGFERTHYQKFSNRLRQIQQDSRNTQIIGGVFGTVALLLLGVASWFIMRSIVRALNYGVTVANTIAAGNWDAPIDITTQDETGHLMQTIREMRDTIKIRLEEDKRLEQRNRQLAALNASLSGELTPEELCQRTLTHLMIMLDAQTGRVYVYDEETRHLRLKGSHATNRSEGFNADLALGEALVGQVAVTKKPLILNELPPDYLAIGSGMGHTQPASLMLLPITHDGVLLGVMEIGALRHFSNEDLALLETCGEHVAISLGMTLSRERLAAALEKSRLALVAASAPPSLSDEH